MSAVPLRRNRDFVLLQTGQLLSNAGAQLTGIAYPLLVLAVTGSAAKAGLVSFVRLLAVRVLDRRGPRDADAVPGGARARPRLAAHPGRRGLPLPLEPSVPADDRVPVRAGELHRPRRAARDRR